VPKDGGWTEATQVVSGLFGVSSRPRSVRSPTTLTKVPLIGHTGGHPGWSSVMYFDPTKRPTVIAYATATGFRR